MRMRLPVLCGASLLFGLHGLFGLGCTSATSMDASESAPPSVAGGPGVLGTQGTGAATGTSASAPAAPVAETEEESNFLSPVATGLYVWTANPSSDRVALVNAESLDVRSLDAGDGPTYLVAVPTPRAPEVNRAAVINVNSHDAMLFTAPASGNITTQRAPIHPGANAWAGSSQGNWLVAWSNSHLVSKLNPTDGFQDITVLSVPPTDGPSAPLRSWRISVGYRPSSVFIAPDESRAFVVCESGVTVVELKSQGPSVLQDVEFTAPGTSSALASEVVITEDGKFALVRWDRSPKVNIVSLDTGAVVEIKLPGAVSDLDLLAGGGGRAIAVVRQADETIPQGAGGSAGAGGASAVGGAGPGGAAGSGGVSPTGGAAGAGGSWLTGGAAGTGGAGGGSSTGGRAAGGQSAGGQSAGGGQSGGGRAAGGQSAGGSGAGGTAGQIAVAKSWAVVLNVSEAFAEPTHFDQVEIKGAQVGSVSASSLGERALLYTNAVASDKLIILDTTEGSTYLSQRAVALKSPIQAVIPAPDAQHAIALLRPDTATSTSPAGFAVVALGKELPSRIQGTLAPIQSVAFAPPPSSRAVITVTGTVSEQKQGTYVIRMPELQVDLFPLASVPLATGLVPAAHKAFIAQEHPEGRITFVDLQKSGPTADLTRTLTGFELSERVVGAQANGK